MSRLEARNRLFNITNPYQGADKRVLCVCSAGLLRSPTAAFILQKEYGFNTRAAGANEEYALIPVTEALIAWSDFVVFMEDRHHKLVMDTFPEVMGTTDHIILNIPDRFARMDDELQNLILTKFKEKYNG